MDIPQTHWRFGFASFLNKSLVSKSYLYWSRFSSISHLSRCNKTLYLQLEKSLPLYLDPLHIFPNILNCNKSISAEENKILLTQSNIKLFLRNSSYSRYFLPLPLMLDFWVHSEVLCIRNALNHKGAKWQHSSQRSCMSVHISIYHISA